MNFIDLMIKPSAITVADEESDYRFEESGAKVSTAKIDYIVRNGVAEVVINEHPIPVKYARLRWNGKVGEIDKILGDQWERSGEAVGLDWMGKIPHRRMPWYFHCVEGDKNALYGVKTGANSFCSWFLDDGGITLFIDLTCGNGGTLIKKPLSLCFVVSLFYEGDAFDASKKFCSLMCDNPVMPKTPIFGVNNWYWAYGRISHESVMRETDYLMEMTEGAESKPYMILDDGWQINRTFSGETHNGGPWHSGNFNFPSMQDTASAILEKGALPGIWLRPLMTIELVPQEAVLDIAERSAKLYLDPSHPFTLEKVETDVKRIADWGYKLIKHDFSCIDITGYSPMGINPHHICRPDVKFFDNTQTTAMHIKNYYGAVQRGAGDSEVIGCNTIGHLTAGIHSAQRVGNDTSGRSYEWTRRNGINSMMRLPQEGTFFNVDPDCAPFTERVPLSLSLDFLEVCALTGMTTLASVTPGILSPSEMKRINEIYRLASKGKGGYKIKGYKDTTCPNKFTDGKNEKEYDWYSYYNGTRTMLNWFD